MICEHLSPARSSLCVLTVGPTIRIRGFSTTMRYINRHYLSIYLYQVIINLSASNEKVFSVAQYTSNRAAGRSADLPPNSVDCEVLTCNVVGLEYADSGRLWGFDIWEAEQANEGCRDHSLCKDEPRRFTPSH